MAKLEKILSIYSIIFFVITILFLFIALYFSPIYAPSHLRFLAFDELLFIFFLTILPVFLVRNSFKNSEKNIFNFTNDKVVFGVVAFTSLLFDLLWLVVFYPGTGMYDTINIVEQGIIASNQHPWLYCMIVEKVKNTIFLFGGNYEIVFFICSIIQIIIKSLIIGHTIIWLKRKNVNDIVVLFIAIFYCFLPIYSIMSVNIFKDILFSYVLLEFSMFLYDFWEYRGNGMDDPRTYIRVGIIMFFLLFRNNGIYISFFVLLILLMLYFKQWKKISTYFLLLFTVAFGSILFEKNNNISPLFKEKVGIPLQQIAATVKYNGKISAQNKYKINKIIPLEVIKNNYDPYSSDPLKWGKIKVNNGYLNSNKKEFFKLWIDLLKDNIEIYKVAYLKATYGFWAFHNKYNGIYSTIYVKKLDHFFVKNKVGIKNVLPLEFQKKAEEFLVKIVKSLFLGEGTLFWIFMFYSCFLALKFDARIFIVSLPAFANWLTLMVGTPIAFQWRYVYIFPLILPLLLGLITLNKDDCNRKIA